MAWLANMLTHPEGLHLFNYLGDGGSRIIEIVKALSTSDVTTCMLQH